MGTYVLHFPAMPNKYFDEASGTLDLFTGKNILCFEVGHEIEKVECYLAESKIYRVIRQ